MAVIANGKAAKHVIPLQSERMREEAAGDDIESDRQSPFDSTGRHPAWTECRADDGAASARGLKPPPHAKIFRI
jgi:hypothetical protein